MQAEKDDQPEEVQSPREQILYNSIDILLNKDSFYDDEEVEGHVLITIKESYSPQRLTLSVVGEIVSQTVGSFKKQRTMLQKMTTLVQNPSNPTISRTFTAKKEVVELESPFKKTLTRGFTRTFTMSTNSKTTTGSRGKIMPVEELKNKELFCHYTVPIFVFKTDSLPAGVYKVPFRFGLTSGVIPSFNYNRDSFQYNIGYMAIAELEERPDNDYGNGFFAGNNNLKCKKEVKINKASTRVQEAQLNASSISSLTTEVVGKLKVPDLMCVMRPNDAKIRLKLEKSSFRMGDRVNFEIISYEKLLKDKKTKVSVNLIEELNKFGDQLESFKNDMKVYGLKFDHDLDKTASKKTVITGSIVISDSIKEGLQPSNEHIEHFFEVVVGYKFGLLRKYISLRISITLKKPRVSGEPESLALDDANNTEERKLAATENAESEEDDEVMVLPLAKFKLEERWNILTKAAQMLDDPY